MIRIWVAAGGSGGHLYPALAVVEEMVGDPPVAEWHFAVSRRGLEEDVLDRIGIPHTALATEGLHRREVVRNLLFPLRACSGLFQSLSRLRKFRPHVAFGTGGFISGPALLAARMLRIPIVLIALDAKPGVVIRMLTPLARQVFVTHQKARAWLSNRANVEVIGTPVRGVEQIEARAARIALGMPRAGRMLLITGGSQGSKALNDAVSAGLGALLDIPDLSILWQTGGTHAEACRASAEEVLIHRPAYDRPRLRVEGFLHDMNVAWSATDLALCRSGASTIAELGRLGVPALLVPLATSAGGHQEANARAMERAGAAHLLLEEELDGSRVAEEVRGLLEGDGLVAMATAAARLVHAGAAHRIALGLVEHAVDLTTREREAVIARLGRVTS